MCRFSKLMPSKCVGRTGYGIDVALQAYRLVFIKCNTANGQYHKNNDTLHVRQVRRKNKSPSTMSRKQHPASQLHLTLETLYNIGTLDPATLEVVSNATPA